MSSTLFNTRLNKVISELKRLGIDGGVAILKDKASLTYIFADLYSPPPEEVGILSIVINLDTLELSVYTSPLEFYRVYEIYSNRNVNVYPVGGRGMDLDLGVKILDPDEYNKVIHSYMQKNRIVLTDDMSMCGDAVCVSIRSVIKKCRRMKEDIEVDMIHRAIEITEKSINKVLSEISPNISEKDIAKMLEWEARTLGADGLAFSTIVAIGINTSKPHHIPSSTTLFRGHEPILIDFGVRVSGYVSDVTRMVIPKRLGDEYKEIEDYILSVEEALENSLNSVKEGVSCRDVDSIARTSLKKKGFNKYFIHALGHGIGVDVHEDPRISQNSNDSLIKGDVVTIEPGVYIRGRFGVRLEDDVYVDSGGYRKLTSLNHILFL